MGTSFVVKSVCGPAVIFVNATILKVNLCITWNPVLRIVQSALHFIPWQTHSVEPSLDLGIWENLSMQQLMHTVIHI